MNSHLDLLVLRKFWDSQVKTFSRLKSLDVDIIWRITRI